MRPYETMVVLSTQNAETAALIDRFASIIEREGGTIAARHDWGVRTMAYAVKNQTHGHYWLIDYEAGPELVKELERNMKISEGVLRFMSIQQPHTGLPEAPRVEERTDGRRDTPLSEMRSRDSRDRDGDRDRDRDRSGDVGPRAAPAPRAAEPAVKAAAAPAAEATAAPVAEATAPVEPEVKTEPGGENNE
ncbi:MAG: small subunit ribosomal protein S6 [Hyphomicrobiaceae bacterium]|jgi:small subunit ribosomal protein S6